MRAISRGLKPRHEGATFRFEGRAIYGWAGDTIASALIDNGELGWRETRSGSRRGLFCGMGVCQECVLLVDGLPARACMTPARQGMTVDPLPWATLPEAATAPTLEPNVVDSDLLVVGGGPGGLAAAAVAAEAGADVVLIDERSRLGGQYFKQPSTAFEVDEIALDAQYRQGRDLIRRVERAGVRLLLGTQVWGATSARELLALAVGASYLLQPRRLVLATGAYERGVPLPGWTLPGFFTTGAAQTLLRAYQVLPGRSVLVSGNGPLNVQVAAELVRAGAKVVALCETTPVMSLRRASAALEMAAAAPDLARIGVGYLRTLREARVPMLYEHVVVRAEGETRVERAIVARVDRQGVPVPGSERVFEVDAVCAGFGFLPSNELARTLAVKHVFDAALGQLHAVRGHTGRTAADGVWVVGDSGGTGGARLAKAVGLLAGIDVLRSLGHTVPDPLVREERAAERAQRRNERFQNALKRLYAAPRLLDQLTDADTLVCRCEEVTRRAVEDAFATGIESIGAIKRVTRVGMGRCQGRYCAPVLAEVAARHSGQAPEESAWFAPAPPFKPLPLAVVAAATEKTLPPAHATGLIDQTRAIAGESVACRATRPLPRDDDGA